MNAVIYARYSSDSQREESIEGQLRECTDYAEHNGMTIVGSYIDRALSAKTADRPEFQRMIKDSAKGLFEIVLVWKLDRFSRDRYDSAHYKHILKKNGVKVVSAKEHISDGPEGIILESMLEGYAEFYSAELSEKIHRGQKENALKGKNNGGGIPLGYLLDKQTQKLVVDPETALLVVEIFERYSEGATVRSIIEDLNSRGLTTKRGKPFSANSFNALLKNRKYIGEYSYQDVVIPGGVPAIVPEDLFYRVQQRMEKNKRAPAHTKAKESEFLLTTKLFCGKCERMMVGESGKSHTGVMHYYYKCGNAKRKKGCDKKAVKKDWIERAVIRLTMERVLNEEKISKIIDALLAMQEREDVTIPALRRQLAEVEKGIENMLNAIQQGIFTASTKQRLEELEKHKEELSLSITMAELQKPKLTREYMEHWFSQFRYGDSNDREFQKRLIDTFVNAVFVYDDKLVLTYNYQHGTQTITLKEVEGFLGSDLVGLSPPEKSTNFDRGLSIFFALYFLPMICYTCCEEVSNRKMRRLITMKEAIVAKLTAKDDKYACALSDKIISESQETDEWYKYFDDFASLLDHPKSLVRNRALYILAANAQWDEENRFDSIISDFLTHITDEKPITARQCIKALAQVGLAKPQYIPRILSCLQDADLSRYKDSMRPLIEKDMEETKKTLTTSGL